MSGRLLRSTKTRCTTDAGLAGVTEGGVGGAQGGLVQVVPVAVNDEGGVAAELEQDALAAGVSLELPAHLGGAGKADQLDAVFLFREPGSVGIRERQHGESFFGPAGFEDDFAERQSGEGGLRGGLEDDADSRRPWRAPALWATRFSGKLNGVMARTGPTGKRCTRPQRFSLPSVRSSGMALAAEAGGFFGGGLEGEHGAIDLGAGEAEGLAGFGDDELGEALLLLDEGGGDVFKDFATLPARECAGAAQAGRRRGSRPGGRRRAWPR